MTIRKRKDTEEQRDFWAFVEQVAKDVKEHFPKWKRGDNGEDEDEDNGKHYRVNMEKAG